MNYPQSQLILDKIKSAKRIILSCHRSPDADTVSCALAMRNVLKSLGKESDIVCIDEVQEMEFIQKDTKIQKIDYQAFNFEKYDLFIIQDSSNFDVVTGDKQITLPPIFKIVLDHHVTNTNFGDINLVDGESASCAEVLYKVFLDWKVKIDSNAATCLLSGIISDSGCFQYAGTNTSSLEIGSKLMQLGADKDEIIFNLFRRIPFSRIKNVGEIISRSEVDDMDFIWSAIPNDIFVAFGEDKEAKGLVSGILFQNVEGTNFGMVLVEVEPKVLSISLRSRVVAFDVSRIAKELGGGGHKNAAGATIKDLPFDQAVKKVLEVARKYAKAS